MAALSLLLVTRFCDGEFYIHRARERTIRENTRFSFQTRPTDPAVPARPILHERAKARRAERLAFEASQRGGCWADVRILNGRAVIEDVYVEGESIRTLSRAPLQ